MRLTMKVPFHWNIFFVLWQNQGAPDEHRHLQRSCFPDHKSWQSNKTLCVCQVLSKIHQSMQAAVARRGLCERGNQGGVPRRANPYSWNGVWKSVLCEEGKLSKSWLLLLSGLTVPTSWIMMACLRIVVGFPNWKTSLSRHWSSMTTTSGCSWWGK